MNDLKKITLGVALCFGLPWLLLIVIPWASMRDLGQVPYAEADEDAVGTAYPPGRSGRVGTGHLVYASEGCAYCHTQMVRPTYAGSDMWREGWGGREDEGLIRETRPRDYLGEPYALLGVKRYGSDLSNVGWRRQDPAWLHRMLYDPTEDTPWSIMPSYAHLYEERAVESAPAENAVRTWTDEETGEQFEIVPTSEAEAVVEYLLSLKKDYKVPVALLRGEIDSSGRAAADAAEPAGGESGS